MDDKPQSVIKDRIVHVPDEAVSHEEPVDYSHKEVEGVGDEDRGQLEGMRGRGGEEVLHGLCGWGRLTSCYVAEGKRMHELSDRRIRRQYER